MGRMKDIFIEARELDVDPDWLLRKKAEEIEREQMAYEKERESKKHKKKVSKHHSDHKSS